MSGNRKSGALAADLTLLHLADGGLATENEQLALAAVLVQASIADGSAPANEVTAIREMLASHCGLGADKISELIDLAASKLASGEKVDGSVAVIKAAFSHGQKLLLLSYVWRVILSDGIVHSRELKAVNALAIKLGLDEESSEEARMIAESGRS